MSFFAILFPAQPRGFNGQRWISILLRTLHLIGIAGVGAAYLFTVPEFQWQPYMILTIFSGSLMIILEVWSHGRWLVQLRGISTILKLIVLSMSFFSGLQPYILITVIVIAGLISHAPGKVRYYSFFND